MNPTVGMVQRLENQINRLPGAGVEHERHIEEARQEYRDAATALGQPFKHEDALKRARWEVERIGRRISGEGDPQPTFDADLEKLQRLQRASFPVPAGSRSGRPPSEAGPPAAEPRGRTAQRDGIER